MSLPTEIIDKIMNMHWCGLYKTNVIDIFHNASYRLAKMMTFLNNHFILILVLNMIN